jgi:hypothetical protein
MIHPQVSASAEARCPRIPVDIVLVLVSVVWGLAVAVSPALAASADAFILTALLISINFLLSTWKLLCRARVYIVLNIAQFALFGLLNYQLYSAGGPEHYRCERPPTLGDWIEFTGAHVLRAADVLDAVDEYAIDIQHIRHASVAAGGVLVLMHLAVDTFLISLIGRWLTRVWKVEQCENKLREGRKLAGWVMIALVVYIGCALMPGWRHIDWILWPLDNVLRVIDVTDAFQIFHWRLHSVEPGPFTSTAAVLFRLAAGLLLGKLFFFVRMVWLTGLGFTVDELIEELEEADPPVRRGAAVALGRSGPEEHDAVLALGQALEEDNNRDVRLAAVQSLAQMGPHALDAVPALIVALEEIYPDVRNAAIDALVVIGLAALPELQKALESRCSWVQHGAREVLWRIAAPEGVREPDEMDAAPTGSFMPRKTLIESVECQWSLEFTLSDGADESLPADNSNADNSRK